MSDLLVGLPRESSDDPDFEAYRKRVLLTINDWNIATQITEMVMTQHQLGTPLEKIDLLITDGWRLNVHWNAVEATYA